MKPHRCTTSACYPICRLRRKDVCARCGCLRSDHMDYGRPDLVCPTTDPGVFTEPAKLAKEK